MSSVRFAIIGTGGIASAYETAFSQTSGAVIAAVCDVRLSVAEAFARRTGCAAFASVESLLMRAQFDAAIVCTPPATHEPIATALLEDGKHVLCEKPLATSVPSAWRMLEAARRNNALLTMASKFRYVADVRNARALARAGGIGELVLVENAFTSHVDMRNRWNSNATISGGGVLIDNGTHAVDILRYCLGNLRDVQVAECRRIQGLPVEDTVRVFAHNDDGVMGTSDLSWSIDKGLETYLRLYGSEGTILVGWRESKYRRRGETAWHVFGKGYDKIQAFSDQISNFVGAINGAEDLAITPRDALASVEVIRAAYAALERVQWERVGGQREEFEFRPIGAGRSLEAS